MTKCSRRQNRSQEAPVTAKQMMKAMRQTKVYQRCYLSALVHLCSRTGNYGPVERAQPDHPDCLCRHGAMEECVKPPILSPDQYRRHIGKLLHIRNFVSGLEKLQMSDQNSRQAFITEKSRWTLTVCSREPRLLSL